MNRAISAKSILKSVISAPFVEVSEVLVLEPAELAVASPVAAILDEAEPSEASDDVGSGVDLLDDSVTDEDLEAGLLVGSLDGFEVDGDVGSGGNLK